MTIANSIRALFSTKNKEIYSPPKKKPMTEAVAERFMWEVLLTNKWDHLFRQTGWCTEGLRFGSVDESKGLPSVYSLGRFPRILAPNFKIRKVFWRKDPMPGHQEIRFCDLDRNDSISVTLTGMGAHWTPVGLQVILLGDHRVGDDNLITEYLVVAPPDAQTNS